MNTREMQMPNGGNKHKLDYRKRSSIESQGCITTSRSAIYPYVPGTSSGYAGMMPAAVPFFQRQWSAHL